jgi:hypothetical protein
MEAPFIHRCGQATTLQYVAAIRPVPRYHFATISTDVSGAKIAVAVRDGKDRKRIGGAAKT